MPNLRRWPTMLVAGLLVLAVLVFVLLTVSDAPTSAVQAISPAALQEQFVTTTVAYRLIDVRTADEFAEEHIHGAVNTPVDTLANRLSEVSRDQPVVVYCHSGNRSAVAAI